MLSGPILWLEGGLLFVQVSKKKDLIKDNDNVLLRVSEDLVTVSKYTNGWF